MHVRKGWLLLVVALGACARAYAPPGGPEDRLPPQLIATRPENGAVVPASNEPVEFFFDEQLSEQGLRDPVIVSPATGEVRVEKRRKSLRVRIEGGWREGTVYRLTLLPGVSDRFRNARREASEIVFSTGPEIPATALAGEVTDRLTGKPVVGAWVQAMHLPDSVRYVGAADSAGFFALRFVPPGEYRITAFEDRVANRRLDPGEPLATWSVTVQTAGDTLFQALAVLTPDSTPAQLARVEPADSLTLRLQLDDHVDVERRLAGVVAELWQLPDSTLVPVAELLYPHEYEQREREAARLREDSIAAAEAERQRADSLAAAAADSVAVPDTAVAPPARPPRPTPRPQPPAPAPRDTAAPLLLPVRELVLRTGRPLEPATSYRVILRGVTNIAGIPGGGGTAVFETPRRTEAAPDTTAPVPDTIVPVPDTIVPVPDATAPAATLPPAEAGERPAARDRTP